MYPHLLDHHKTLFKTKKIVFLKVYDYYEKSKNLGYPDQLVVTFLYSLICSKEILKFLCKFRWILFDSVLPSCPGSKGNVLKNLGHVLARARVTSHYQMFPGKPPYQNMTSVSPLPSYMSGKLFVIFMPKGGIGGQTSNSFKQLQ